MPNFKKYKYKVLEENKDDFKASRIEKSGISAELTIYELEGMEKEVRKQLTEATAQYNLEAAKMENIERNHEYVKDFTDEQLFTIHMYAGAKSNYKKYKGFAEKTEENLGIYDAEMKDMYEKLGVTPSPYVGTENTTN